MSEETSWVEEAIAWAEKMKFQAAFERGYHEAWIYLQHRMLQKRFGTLPPDLPGRLGALDRDALEGLLDVAITAASLDEVLAHLPQQAGAARGGAEGEQYR